MKYIYEKCILVNGMCCHWTSHVWDEPPSLQYGEVIHYNLYDYNVVSFELQVHLSMATRTKDSAYSPLDNIKDLVIKQTIIDDAAVNKLPSHGEHPIVNIKILEKTELLNELSRRLQAYNCTTIIDSEWNSLYSRDDNHFVKKIYYFNESENSKATNAELLRKLRDINIYHLVNDLDNGLEICFGYGGKDKCKVIEDLYFKNLPDTKKYIFTHVKTLKESNKRKSVESNEVLADKKIKI